MTRPASFKSSDLQRAVKAMKALNLPVRGVEITRDGAIRVLTDEPAPTQAGPQRDLSPLERWELEHGGSPS